MSGINEPQDEGNRLDAPAAKRAPTLPRAAQTALEITPTVPGPIPGLKPPEPRPAETAPFPEPQEVIGPPEVAPPPPEPSAPSPAPARPAELSKHYSDLYPALRKARERKEVEQLHTNQRGNKLVWIGTFLLVAILLAFWFIYSARAGTASATGKIACLVGFVAVIAGILVFWRKNSANTSNTDGTANKLPQVAQPNSPRELVQPQADHPWTNSLGMRFVSVPGTKVLFSIWHTRVQDFEAFVRGTGCEATAGMNSLKSDGWKQRGDSWKSPGFAQGPTHPVCGASWDDARVFCAWLTKKEQETGKISLAQSYRLPTDAEWSVAMGNDLYPWGGQWPPPARAGNYAGAEAADENWPGKYTTIPGYNDGYARTSPVGSFNANRYGLHDMGGNLWQWCEDWYRKELNHADVRKEKPALDDDGGGQKFRVLRGASWQNGSPIYLRSDCRYGSGPANRNDVIGFRCVLVAGDESY